MRWESERDLVLIKVMGKKVAVGSGRHCFPIENGRLVDAYDQRLGSAISGSLEAYETAFQEARLAYELGVFDYVQEDGK